MEAYAAEKGNDANVVLLNIEGVKKAKSFRTGELNSVVHGGVVGGLPDEFGLAYIPHHVIVGTDGKVIVNYDGFSFDKVPSASGSSAKSAASVKIAIQWCGG